MILSLWNFLNYKFTKSKYFAPALAESKSSNEKEFATSLAKYTVKIVKYVSLPYFGDHTLLLMSTNGFIIHNTNYVVTIPISPKIGLKVTTHDHKVFDADLVKSTTKLTLIELKNCNKNEYEPYAVQLKSSSKLYKPHSHFYVTRPSFLKSEIVETYRGHIIVNENSRIDGKMENPFFSTVMMGAPVFNEDAECLGLYIGTWNQNILTNEEIWKEIK